MPSNPRRLRLESLQIVSECDVSVFNRFVKLSKMCFLFGHYVELSVDGWEK